MVQNLLTPELTLYLAQDLDRQKDPGGTAVPETQTAATCQPGEIADKQTGAWAATVSSIYS